jgi:hypothetical protein
MMLWNRKSRLVLTSRIAALVAVTVIGICLGSYDGFCASPFQEKAEKDKTSNAGKAASDYKVEGSLEVSLQFRDVRGDRVAKFQEYRDVPQGFVLDSARLSIRKENSPFYLDFSSRKAIYRDKEYSLDCGVFGQYKSRFSFNEIPHFFSNRNTLLLTGTAPGVFSINNTVRAALQPADDITTIGIVNDLLANAPAVDLQLRREQTTLSQELTPRGSKHWKVYFDLDHERRAGERAIGAGTYVRRGTSLGDQFDLLGIELPEPIRYRTLDFSAGATYARDRGFFSAQYAGSYFRNSVDALKWMNPFRLTDAQATPPGGATARGNFAAGQMALYPDNQAHTFTFAGGVHLPMATLIKSSFSFSRLTQDAEFGGRGRHIGLGL